MGEDKGRQDPSVVITTILSTVITITAVSVILSSNASALTYQDSVDVSFTFDPTLSISLSSNNISIDNLVPGNFAHSNTITINVSTNNVYGYTLTAKVGEDGGSTGTSASSDLVNTSSNTPFTSLSPNDRLTLSNFANNTWGYTTSANISDTTTAYTGLLYNTDTTINMTKNSTGTALGRYQGTNTTNFTIGTSASTDQLSGTYTNTITFTTVTNMDVPSLCNPSGTTISTISCMQDINESNKASILASMTEDSQYQLVDNRDEKTYWVAKLKDGNVWMTQNLDLCIGCSGVAALTSENTDLNKYDTNGDGTGTTLTHYTYDSTSATITWTPTASTLAGSPATIYETTVTGWSNVSSSPYMAEGGDRYSVRSTHYNSLELCKNGSAMTEAECMHYHIGNYYNFSAAVAMSGVTNYATNGVMPNSICPKGWRLSNGITDSNASGIDYIGGTNLAKANWTTVGYLNIGVEPIYLIRSGNIGGSSLNGFSTNGIYWTSTTGDDSEYYSLYYNGSVLRPAYLGPSYFGRPVRCLLR